MWCHVVHDITRLQYFDRNIMDYIYLSMQRMLKGELFQNVDHLVHFRGTPYKLFPTLTAKESKSLAS